MSKLKQIYVSLYSKYGTDVTYDVTFGTAEGTYKLSAYYKNNVSSVITKLDAYDSKISEYIEFVLDNLRDQVVKL